MLPDLLLLVHRRRSPSPSHPYHSSLLLEQKQEICVAQTTPVHAQAWFTSIGQEVRGPRSEV